MAYLITSDDDYRDLTYDDAYRSYLITRTETPYDYRFGRTQGRRMRVRARMASGRVNGFLKNMIESIVNSKLLRKGRPARKSPTDAALAMTSIVSLVRRVAGSLLMFLSPSWDRPVQKYHPEQHYMRGPGPKCREKRALDRASAGSA